ncbi:iron-sulfur cluster repair di-iron protein, ric [Clostridiaceae bacterium OttesenSCG-928-D20]|nr:iron-sulfur cluster repair di-iron protein, ric [Clostridiaceae bacterium OttesenSCG-928-D20]
MNRESLNLKWGESLEKLKKFLPLVCRVHGSEHPEIFEVSELYNQISENISKEDFEPSEIFFRLRELTNNYSAPADTCVTYEAVYNMLSELDAAYFEN